MHWILKSFSELTPAELYAILALRNQVFICEQQCAYQDIDGVDEKTLHLFALCDKTQKLAAYARLLPQNIVFPEASIGRVIVAPEYRGEGLAHQLVNKAIEHTQQQFNTQTIKIMAQEYLITFYQAHGFVVTSPVYLEDNIAHVDMLLVKK